MNLDYLTYQIAQHWMTALEYGDHDSLSDEEIEQINAFLDSLPRNAVSWEWGDEKTFARDEVSGLYADCVEGVLWINEDEEQ